MIISYRKGRKKHPSAVQPDTSGRVLILQEVFRSPKAEVQEGSEKLLGLIQPSHRDPLPLLCKYVCGSARLNHEQVKHDYVEMGAIVEGSGALSGPSSSRQERWLWHSGNQRVGGEEDS